MAEKEVYKICRYCKETKSVKMFYKDIRYKGGFKNICKECQNTERNGRRKHRRGWVQQLKIDKGCSDCGYNEHPEALQFDHLPEFEKVVDISKLADASQERYVEEIKKCEVVCANCHAIRTYNRRKKIDE